MAHAPVLTTGRGVLHVMPFNSYITVKRQNIGNNPIVRNTLMLVKIQESNSVTQIFFPAGGNALLSL